MIIITITSITSRYLRRSSPSSPTILFLPSPGPKVVQPRSPVPLSVRRKAKKCRGPAPSPPDPARTATNNGSGGGDGGRGNGGGGGGSGYQGGGGFGGGVGGGLLAPEGGSQKLTRRQLERRLKEKNEPRMRALRSLIHYVAQDLLDQWKARSASPARVSRSEPVVGGQRSHQASIMI
jgi:hypothetical protein